MAAGARGAAGGVLIRAMETAKPAGSAIFRTPAATKTRPRAISSPRSVLLNRPPRVPPRVVAVEQHADVLIAPVAEPAAQVERVVAELVGAVDDDRPALGRRGRGPLLELLPGAGVGPGQPPDLEVRPGAGVDEPEQMILVI